MDGRRILGIDPGLNITGYGVLEVGTRRPRVIEAGVLRGTKRGCVPSRVKEIYSGLCDVIAQTKPDVVSLEKLYSHYNRPTTAILMGHARGVICLAAANADLNVADYAATKIKKILTGNGRAPKAQVQEAVTRELGLESVPEPADVADALAIAMCHYYLVETKTGISASAF